MITKKVKTANNRLQQLYFHNLIAYPRVELSYSTHPQSILSHKPLPTIGTYFEPFYAKYLEFNKMTSLLFLNTTSFITPSLTSKISTDIDLFFTMDMKLKQEKKLMELIEAKDIFLSRYKVKLTTQTSKPSFFNPKYFDLFTLYKPMIKKIKIKGLSFSGFKKKKIDELEQKSQEKILDDDIFFNDIRALKKYIEIKNERQINEKENLNFNSTAMFRI